MKKISYLILYAAMLALIPYTASAGCIVHNLTFDTSKLKINYDTIDNDVFAKVYYDDMMSVNCNGQPVLPSNVLLFSVPYNADAFSVRCNVISYSDFLLDADVYPGPQIVDINDASATIYNQKDSIIYGMSCFYPDTLFRVIGSGFMSGGNKVLKTHLYPLSYNPSTRTIRLATSLQLIINYNDNSLQVPNIFRKNNDLIQKEMSLTASYVQNSDEVVSNAFEPQVALNSERVSSFPTYNYCIITSRELEPAFKKIIAMKRQKGLSAGVICIEDLIASPLFNTGDYNYNESTSQTYILNDSAGIVRKYLKYAFQSADNPTSYVLLGGKKNHAPVRYFGVSRYIATDMYYSDLTQLWDNEGNIWIGEGTQIDLPISYWPDLYVGRILCDKKSEIDNYSNKLHQYVFNPGDGDRSYLERALYFCNKTYEDDCEDTAPTDGYFFNSTNVMKCHNSNYTGVDIINDINTTRYGYISEYCNGDAQAMWIYSGHILTALDEYIPIDQYCVDEAGNGFDNLTNKFFPSIFYSLASSAITFENSTDLNTLTQFANKYNLSESFTVGSNYGGIAYLGNTKTGYREWTSPLERCFFKSMRRNNGYKLGVSEGMSKVLNVPFHEYWYYGPYNQVIASHNLIGDPEVDMWTSEPQDYSRLGMTRYQARFYLTGVNVNDTIAYCDNNGNIGRTCGHNGIAVLSGVSHNSSIMVYNHEHIPYIFPLILQDCDIRNSQYVYASSFSAGRSILPNLTNGNVVIKNGAVYEIDATDDVHLGEGFIVENGATFAIKTPGKVTIDGCVFQSGAIVKIESGNVEIAKSFTAERGSKVEIIKFVD